MSKFEDLTGQKYNKLTVLKTFRKNNRSFCECLCDCGNITIVEKYSLKSGGTKTCGCSRRQLTDIENVEGKTFGKWNVLKYYGYINHNLYYLCRCKCGIERLVKLNSLKSGSSKSCGCLQKEIVKNLYNTRTHGLTNSRLYRIYCHMKERCNNKNCSSYKNYGGRGITVCKEWLDDFMSFYNWALNNGYADDLTIDRINNDGNYEPNNCRWVNSTVQANNRRTSHYIIYKNKKYTIAELLKNFNLKNESYLYSRIARGWDIDKALATPKAARHSK